MSGTLHLAPDHSATTSLRHALRAAGLDEEVVAFPDDFSCGPIDGLEGTTRAEWWGKLREGGIPGLELQMADFRARVAAANGRLVVWAGRRSAKEHAFLLALAHGLGDRPFSAVGIAERQGPSMRRPAFGTEVPGAVSVLPPGMLQNLIGTERPVAPEEHARMRERWCTLRQENAPFRVAAGTELISAPEDYFDPALMAQVTAEPQSIARIVGRTFSHDRTYMQVGDLVLHVRLITLIESGRLAACGALRDMRTCFVRLPGATRR